jgi:peptidoglycan/LPS O-acetylase OafA/YrhL
MSPIDVFKVRSGVLLKSTFLILMLRMPAFSGEANFERSGLAPHFAMVGIFAAGCVLLFDKESSKFYLLVGNLTYGINLNHFLLLAILKPGIGRSLLRNVFGLCLIAVGFGAAFLLEKFIQRPIGRWRWARTSLEPQDLTDDLPTAGGASLPMKGHE